MGHTLSNIDFEAVSKSGLSSVLQGFSDVRAKTALFGAKRGAHL